MGAIKNWVLKRALGIIFCKKKDTLREKAYVGIHPMKTVDNSTI